MTDDYIEEQIAAYNERVYGGNMPVENIQRLREQLKREDEFWTREAADFIRGFDDGEPQTTVDYNHN